MIRLFIIVLNLIIFMVPGLYSYNAKELKKDTPIWQYQAQDLIENLIIIDKLADMDRILEVYKENFIKIDLPQAYYEAGIKFYNKQLKGQALQAFMKGYGFYQDSIYKTDCLFYISKILYQDNKRESALVFINRLITKLNSKENTNQTLRDEAQKLKRRIRWEYLSKSEGLPDDSISDVEFDGDDVWLCMWTGGIARYTRSSRTLILFNPQNSGLVSIHIRDCRIFKIKSGSRPMKDSAIIIKRPGNGKQLKILVM